MQQLSTDRKILIVGIVALALAVFGFVGYDQYVVQPRESALANRPLLGETSGGVGALTLAPIQISQQGAKIQFRSGATAQFDAGSNESHANAASHAGAETHTGPETFTKGTFSTITTTVQIVSSESITPTNNGTITPTARIVSLTPASAVTITLGTCVTNTVMTIYDAVNQAVIITDTGNFVAAGNQTLGQYDTLPAVCIGGVWVQDGPVSAN